MSQAYGKDKDGKVVTYNFNIEAQNRKLERKWFKLASEDLKKKVEQNKEGK
jgi:hypothetical protein